MSLGSRRALDNIFTERLWRSVEDEEVYLNEYLIPRQAWQALARYFQFYNYERPYQALGYLTPTEVYLPMMPLLTKGTNVNEQTLTNDNLLI